MPAACSTKQQMRLSVKSSRSAGLLAVDDKSAPQTKTGSVRQEDRHIGKQTDNKVCMSWIHLIVIRKGHVQQPTLQSRAVLQHLHNNIDAAVVAAGDVEQANP